MIKKKFILALFAALAFSNIRAQIIVAAGTAGNYTIANYPGNFTNYYDGFSVIFRSNHNSLANPTMSIAGLPAKPIFNTAGVALSANDIRMGQVVTLVYDNANVRFQMITASGNAGSGTIAGSGTLNFVPKFTPNGTTLGNSLIFDNGANVGIGTNVPETQLHVLSAISTYPRGITSHQTSTDIASAVIRLAKARGTIAAPVTVLANDEIGEIEMAGFDGSYVVAAAIKSIAAENFSIGAIDRHGSDLTFSTATLGGGSGSVLTEKMTILADGNVGIGIKLPAYKLDVRGSGAATYAQIKGTLDAGLIMDAGAGTETSVFYYRAGVFLAKTYIPSADNSLRIFVNAADRMTFLPNGNVGIGISTPTVALEVQCCTTKTVTAPFQNNFQVGSTDGASPLAIKMGFKPDATAANRYAAIEVDDAGTKRNLILQPAGGNVGIGTTTVSPNSALAIKDGHFQSQQTAAPGITAGAALGSTAISLTNATDVAGKLGFNPGASATAGAMAVITFNKPYAVAPIVVLTPANNMAAQGAAGKQVYLVSVTTTGFTIGYFIDPNTAPDLSGIYHYYNYHIIETL